MICSLFVLVEDASGDHMVEADSSEGLVMAIRVSYYLPHNIALSAFNICSDLFVVCEFMVKSDS